MTRNKLLPVLLLSFASVIALSVLAYRQWYQSRCQQLRRPATLADMGTPPQPYNVLFLGDDLNYSWVGRKQVPDVASFKGRSDSLILLRVDPMRRTITGIHIPRDTMAAIPGYGVQKINAANALGGPELAEQTVAELLGQPIDHYIVLNVRGIVDAVNELGGITVDIPKKMSYMDWTAKLKIDLQPGLHTLTGNQAMGFVRFRHDQLGDIGRIQRQEIFIRAFERKMLTPQSWSHIPRLLAIMHDSVATDLSDTTLIQTFNLLRELPKDGVRFAMLPGHFGQSGTWIADADAAQTLASRMVGNADDGTVTDRQSLKIAVKNVSSIPDLDVRVADMLRKNGYSVVVLAGDTPVVSSKHQTRIIAQSGNYKDAQTVQRDLGGGDIVNASIGDIYSNITVLVDDDMARLMDAAMPTAAGTNQANPNL